MSKKRYLAVLEIDRPISPEAAESIRAACRKRLREAWEEGDPLGVMIVDAGGRLHIETLEGADGDGL